MVRPMTTNSTPSLVSVQDLAARRGDRLVFEGLEFSLEPGDALIVTGPNGSGKSTLLRILAGLLEPYHGDVSFGDSDPSSLCFAGHLDGLKGAMTVAENIKFWADIYEANGNAISEAMDLMDLNTVADMPTDILSAGWRRRVGLTRLLLSSAPTWILDEPFTALDTENVARLDALFARHLEKEGAIVLATHQETSFASQHRIDMRDFTPKQALIQDHGW